MTKLASNPLFLGSVLVVLIGTKAVGVAAGVKLPSKIDLMCSMPFHETSNASL